MLRVKNGETANESRDIDEICDAAILSDEMDEKDEKLG
jgi:hypothetical protein